MKNTNTSKTLWRDDDVSRFTCLHTFKEIHKGFIKRKETHTAAVLMKDLWENQGIFYYLATAPYLEIGLHGWTHKDYSTLNYDQCYEEIKKSIHYWVSNSERMVGTAKKIDTFFAPWNRESEEIKRACQDNGLKFCNVRKGNWNGQNVISFHWWSYESMDSQR
jgi:peptidoglycan/xylan/chitin deacetylase (PgdA/CDA1 family)